LPGTVKLRVLNGTGVNGQGSQTAVKLSRFSFNIAGTGDADKFSYVTPVIRYGRGQQLKAQLLAAYIEGGATIKQDLTLQGVDLVLVTGSALGGIRAPGNADPAEPTTSAPASPAATKPQPKGAPPVLNC